MAKSIVRTYSRQTQLTLTLLSQLIKSARLEQQMSAQEVADRAGISRSTYQRIEKGDPKCEIGMVFEVAVIVGVPLFEAEPSRLREKQRYIEEKLALLPQRIREQPRKLIDDF